MNDSPGHRESYPYPSRPDSMARSRLGELGSDPEVTLSPEERTEALRFEEELTTGKDMGKEKALGIEKIWEKKVNTTDFYLEYFLTEEGGTDLVSILGVAEDDVRFDDTDDVAKFLYGFDYSEVEKKALRKLSGNSATFVDKQTAAQFEEAGFESVEEVHNPTKIVVVRNPAVLAEKIQGYKKLKRYHKTISRELSSQDDSLSSAKRVLLGIHRRKVNELIAQNYPEAVALLHQEEIVSSEEGEKALEILQGEMMSLRIFSQEGNPNQRSMARINNFIYGVGGDRNPEGDYVPLSLEAKELADELSTAQDGEEAEVEKDSLVDDLGISGEKLSSVRVTAEEYHSWVRQVLEEYDILSDQKDYDPDRAGRAEDDLWQVVIDGGVTSLDVGAKQGVIRIPDNYDESIEKAVSVLDHEIAHVVQHENKERLGISIAHKVGMDRRSINAEAGAISWEREVREQFFGKKRLTSPHYLKAMQARMDGGSYKDSMKAFFDSYVAQYPKGDKREAAKLAANRARRLFRYQGTMGSESIYLTNSQPLVYLEQELLAREVKKEGLTNLLMIGGASIQALSELKSIGFLDEENIVLPDQRPSEIVKDQIVEKLKA